uniref:Tyrosinase_Cu-bd domain-containing protein n=1 Tax=Rhabditophanes sp. KR3021 TaxID=114890 RepID=A0AC35U6I3_9BILA
MKVVYKRTKRGILENIGQKVVRKEYRMMSDEERREVHKAMNRLKTLTIDNITLWDLHTLIHYPDSALAAHWGPAFLPYHREFLRQFETALQNENPLVAMPYWDSTLDCDLPDPSDSIMWTDDFMGNGNGYVKTGAFKDWSTNSIMPLSSVPIQKLFRYTGGRHQDRLLSEDDIKWILNRKAYKDLTFCHDKTFESMHGLSHVWVGGFMFVIRVSPNDPMFYMHHAFIDSVWERFRQSKQNRYQRENDYAENICYDKHSFDSQMHPFSLKNKDGLSNDYTDYWYEYKNVKHCDSKNPVCEDTPYYWCDTKVWRCKSKIRLGGNCKGLEDQLPCYKSTCLEGKCKLQNSNGNGMDRIEKTLNNVVWAKTLLLNRNYEPIMNPLGHITITDEYNLFNETSFIERAAKFPEYPGTIYMALPKPASGFTHILNLIARDEYGNYCQSYCYNITAAIYQVCDSIIKMNVRMDKDTNNIAYTHSLMSRKYLDIDFGNHPSKWYIQSPDMIFACHSKRIDVEKLNKSLKSLVTFPVPNDETVWFRIELQQKMSSKTNLENLEITVIDEKNPYYNWKESVKKIRSPFDYNTILVRAPNPYRIGRGVSVKILPILDGQIVNCAAKCSKGSYIKNGTCTDQVYLHFNKEYSDENVFTSSENVMNLIGWKMVGHPSKWQLTMPYLTLIC